MSEEFKKFILKGNIIDLAIAVIVGGAFGKIISSFVSDIIMPPIGVILGGVNFSDLKIVIKQASDEAEAVTINYGVFANTIIDFLIIGIALFFVVKSYNSFKKKEEAAPKAPPAQEVLLTEIRDLLKKD